LGSGETAPSGQKAFDWVMRHLPPPIRVAILETPAGFQPNTARVAGKIADFLNKHLQNYDPAVTLVPARHRDTSFSPNDLDTVHSLLEADLMFMGPGSPTYTIRQLQNSLAWHIMRARHYQGAAIVLASAATISIGRYALPVYEIYKVGEELHWQTGLDLLGPWGLSLVFLPHWNNREGGADLDTSHCFMGRDRFKQLREMLPAEGLVVGIDEHTALILQPDLEQFQVTGNGRITLLSREGEKHFEPGSPYPLKELGSYHRPGPPEGIPQKVWAQLEIAQRKLQQAAIGAAPPKRVWTLVEKRHAARKGRDWSTADDLRDEIAALGWQVLDTPEGPKLEPVE
jgi:hypothetical protein